MGNLITAFKNGQEGKNKGIPLGGGLKSFSDAINGLQRARMYGIGAAPKVGKTTLHDAILIEVILYCIKHDIPIEWIYYSFEITRIEKEFEFCAHFMKRDYGILNIKLPEGVTKKGSNTIPISSKYLSGRLLDDNGDLILVKESIKNILAEVYEKRIVPLFGRYYESGKRVPNSKSIIIFKEVRNNPTGIYKEIKEFAKKRGVFLTEKGNNRITGYNPYNKETYTFISIDHIRKIHKEQGQNIKWCLDQLIEYCIDLKRWCGYSFFLILHLNRDFATMDRLKSFGDKLYPTPEVFKDTGNLSEEADLVITLFNPNDGRYNLQKHFGLNIRDKNGNPLYQNMRTLHIVEGRYVDEFPQHFRMTMHGNTKDFQIFKLKKK